MWIPGDHVDVWIAGLSGPEDHFRRAWDIMNEEERQRARRYRVPEAARRFIASRLFLRELLEGYTGMPAKDLRFRYGFGGKPEIDLPGALEFNLSHSADWAALAVAQGVRVGIDIEATREVDFTGLARRFFAPAEAKRIENCAPRDRLAAFFFYWTCKEAYLKARGDGLQAPLDGFKVLPAERGREVRLTSRIDPPGARWYLQTLDIATGVAGAIAVEGDARPVRCRFWPPPDA
jgi:4'-phosphopantetheinyl transferase